MSQSPVEYEAMEPSPVRRRVSIFRICGLVAWGIAVNFGWNASYVLAAPLFMELGVPAFWVSFATMSIQITGLLQPFLGAISDHYRSRFGRRRPFIVAGIILSVVGMVVFANSQKIGRATGRGNGFAVFVAVASMWIFNIGLNTMMAGSMAIQMDTCVTAEDQTLSMAMYSASYGISCIAAYFLGFVDFVATFKFFDTNYQAVFYLGILIVIMAGVPPVLLGHDPPNKHQAKVGTVLGTFKDMGRTVWNMSPATKRLIVAYWTSCACGYPWQLFYTAYVAQDVFHGDPEAPVGSMARINYDAGVRFGSLALGFMGIVVFLVSLPSEKFLKWFGYKAVWGVGHLWGIVSFVACSVPILSTKMPAMAFCIVAGVYNSFTTAAPWALLGLTIDEKDNGLYSGVMMVMQVTAQLAAQFSAGFVADWSKNWGLGSLGPAIASGSIIALLGIPLIAILIVPEAKPLSNDSEQEESPPEQRLQNAVN